MFAAGDVRIPSTAKLSRRRAQMHGRHGTQWYLEHGPAHAPAKRLPSHCPPWINYWITPPNRLNTPAASGQSTHEHTPVVGVKYFTFAFYQASPALRQLPQNERRRLMEEFLSILASEKSVQSKRIPRSGSGGHGFLFWMTAPRVDLQRLQIRLYRTGLINHLSLTYNYLAMVKPSPISRPHTHEAPPIERSDYFLSTRSLKRGTGTRYPSRSEWV